ncbi:hypothetical protein [Marinobacterium sedimentorum]|uniref:hypothetical protein n=1 Tax=Marinobacterium sedimentorum TaxID=2927804 RepID=UPI0020C6F22D|nr:hypothetical protein [Marinobacterium sedimentorum]MCP8688249.1 hypothetical protein [Marinobacterium sedimentorum]
MNEVNMRGETGNAHPAGEITGKNKYAVEQILVVEKGVDSSAESADVFFAHPLFSAACGLSTKMPSGFNIPSSSI